MATLIAVYNKSGCVGRCDAKCYDAKNPECDCICGGKNHGAGLEKAIEQTREQVEQWLEEYAKEKRLDSYKPWINSNLVEQISLFDTKNFTPAMSKG